MLTLGLIMLLGAALLAAGGVLFVRMAGGHPLVAVQFARLPQLAAGEAAKPGSHDRVARIAGRIRCADPIVTADGERLVAFHRDVEVHTPDGWRGIERVRETRSFELWDHAGALTVDAADAAEPLVVIPRAWRGSAADLDASFGPALARLRAERTPPGAARAVTRTVSVVDRVLVSGIPRAKPDGGTRLMPPPRGHIVSSLELPDAMRLLGGPHKGRLLAGVVVIGLAVVSLVAGAVV